MKGNGRRFGPWLNRLSVIIGLLVFAMAFVLIFMSANHDKGERAMLKHLGFSGDYSIDDGPQTGYDPDVPFSLRGKHTIVFRGHFTEDIENNENIMFFVYNLRVNMKVNGATLYTYGFDRLSSFSQSTGSSWRFFRTSGITTSDAVEITVQSIYSNTSTQYLLDFINSFSYGSGYELFQDMLHNSSLTLMLGFIIAAVGFVEFIICLIAFIGKIPKAGLGLILSNLTVIGGLWFLFNKNYYFIQLLFTDALMAHIIDIVPLYLIPIYVSFVIQVTLKDHTWIKTAARIMTIALSFIIISFLVVQLLGKADLYEMESLVMVLAIPELICLILFLLIDIHCYHNGVSRTILFIFVPLLLGAFLDIVNYVFTFMPIRTAFVDGIVVTLFVQTIFVLRLMYKGMRSINDARRMDNELLQSKIAIMVSQMQPHFMFNTLTTIKHLCMEDAEKARDAIDYFSAFLRRNIDSLTTTLPVPFEQELHHVECYLKIEKIRMEERLKVIYDIRQTDFYVPTLALQPLVENAVRYGISKKKEGGVLRLSTFEDDHHYIIEVIDDGVGFDAESVAEKTRSHIGIHNVRTRLQMVGGTLDVDSQPGQGTVARITIPKNFKGGANRHEDTDM